MEIHRLLEKKKPVILERWLAAIYDTYPADTARFLEREKDQFSNPVGYNSSANACHILEGLIRGEEGATLSSFLEGIIRIRAVQDFTPTQAVSFVSSLKTIIADQLEPEIRRHNLWSEWEELQASIDNLTFMAYEIHAKMKQKIQHIRMKEIEKNERIRIKLMGSPTL